MTNAQHEYWYNTLTGQVEHGRQTSWTNRLGPFPTYEAALEALKVAQERSKDWDEQDRVWRGDGQDDEP